jgi:hypothetical protein
MRMNVVVAALLGLALMPVGSMVSSATPLGSAGQRPNRMTRCLSASPCAAAIEAARARAAIGAWR